MPNKELALRARESIQHLYDPINGPVYGVRHITDVELFDSVEGTVIYVGCGQDLSSLFYFSRARTFVHQDIRWNELDIPLLVFQHHGIISRYSSLKLGENTVVHRFTIHGEPKKLVEVQMDIEEGVPEEAKYELQAIFFLGVPYPRVIRALQKELLPHLKLGGIFDGAYPYNGGDYEGGEPEQLGLMGVDGTYIKERQVDYEEIVAILRANRSKYFRSFD